MLVVLVNLVFSAAQGAMIVHIVLSPLRRAWPVPPRWMRSAPLAWIDGAGAALLRPSRILFDRIGITRRTRPFDLSPLLSFFALGWLHGLLIGRL